MAFQFRRGTDAERQSITPKPGEPLYVTDTGKVYVGDGTTQGGNLVSISVSDDDSPSLGGNLDLNGNDIVGTGNINIDGFINATGNINLGDGAEDNVIVGGVIESNLVPGFDGVYDIGSVLASWRGGFFEGLTINGSAVAESIQITTIYGDDSTVLYESSSDTMSVSTIEGNLIGSVIGQDSTILIDNESNEISTGFLTISDSKLTTSNIEGIIAVENLDPDGKIRFEFQSNSPSRHIKITGPTDGINTAGSNIRTFRGDYTSQQSVQAGDTLAADIIEAYDGSDYNITSFVVHRTDPNEVLSPGNIGGRIELRTLTDSNISNFNGVAVDSEGFFSINQGEVKARAALDVNGGAIFNSEIEAPAVKSTVVGDDSNVLVDGVAGEIVGPIRDIEIRGNTGTPTDNTDNLNPTEWLEITVNGSTRYIPLYT